MVRYIRVAAIAGMMAVATAAVSVCGQSQPDSGTVAIGEADRTVLVLPIVDPAGGTQAGIGRAIQQDIVTDLTTLTKAHAVAPANATAASDEAAAVDEGRRLGAAYVVWGDAQVSGGQMRVTGQLLNVSSGQALAALKATAPADNLFPLEDSLAAQAAKGLPQPIGLVAPPQTQPAAAQSGAPYASGTPAMQPLPGTPGGATTEPYYSVNAGEPQTPYYSYTESIPPTYYTYNTYYAYPGYWYDPYWPYWGWGGAAFIGGGYWPYYHHWYGGGWGYHEGFYHGGFYHGGYHHGGFYGAHYGAGFPRGGGWGFRGAAGGASRGGGAGGFHGRGGGGAHR